MIEIALHYNGELFKPFSFEDEIQAKNLKPGLVNAKLTGVKKDRSWKQLKMFWKVCRKVADNTSDDNWDTADKVAEQCKIKVRYIKETVVVDNRVHIITGSISYKALAHMQACNFFNQAYKEMAKHLKVTVERLLESVDDL